MTLDEMYIECAQQADEEIEKTGGAYADKSLIVVNKFKSGINYAYKKIAIEKWMPLHKENVVLDANLQLDVDDFTKTFNGISRIEDSDGEQIKFNEITDSLIECPDEEVGDTVTVYYFYIPEELSGLTDEPVFPVRAVDHKILCYFGTYMFLSIDDEPKSEIWLNLFNDGFENIRQSSGVVINIKSGTW